MNTNEQKVTLKDLIDKGLLYVETNINLIKLKTVNKGSSVTSAFLTYLIIVVFILILIILLSIGISLWIGKILGETYYGFFITSGFFLLLITLLYALRNKLLKIPIANSLVQN